MTTRALMMVFALLLLAAPALAADYRVDNTAGGASDSNDCLDDGTPLPCLTIAGALAKITTGTGPHTITVIGTYAVKTTIRKSGTAGNPITVRGHTGTCPTTANSDPHAPLTRPAPTVVIAPTIDGDDAFAISASHVTIDCFDLRPNGNAGGALVGAGVRVSGNGRASIRIINNLIQRNADLDVECKWGVYSSQDTSSGPGFVNDLYAAHNYITRCRVGFWITAQHSTLEWNETYRLQGSGDTDHVRVFGTHLTIRKNYHHGNIGIDSAGGAGHIDCWQTYYHGGPWGILKHALIEENTCLNAHQGFLSQGSGDSHQDITLRNNLFANGPADGASRMSWAVLVEGTHYVTMVHNTFGTGSVGCRGYARTPSSCFLANNIFVEAAYPRPIQSEATGQPASYLHVVNNLFFHAGRTLSGLTYPSNIWNVDPLVDADFRPLATSPAKDAGRLGYGVARDRRGVARDARPDVGAYEVAP